MVNTFLVHPDFKQSAQLLDHRRLPNQRREAFQILNNIQRLKALGQLTLIPLPADPYQWYPWIRQVIQLYKMMLKQHPDQQYARIHGHWQWVSRSTATTDPVELAIGYGYIYHPAVLMWLGYEEALKSYLNAHIEVSMARGIHNKMPLQSISIDETQIIRPQWTNDLEFIMRHRHVLLKKELDRHESPWYQLISDFILSGYPAIYYWPYTPSIGTSAKSHGEADTQRKYVLTRVRIAIKIRAYKPLF